MAAETDRQEQIGEAGTDARMQIQDIIESLNSKIGALVLSIIF